MADWYVYILECSNGSYYAGITTDLARRFQEHRNGGARFTKYNPPTRMLYAETCPTRSAALRREAAIRRLGRPDKEALVRRAKGVRLARKAVSRR